MKCLSWSLFFASFVLLAISVVATSDGNNTTNVIHMFPPNIANTKKGKVIELNETNKSNESVNLTEVPLRWDEPIKKLNESKAEVGQNGKWNSFSNVEECDPSNRCVDQKKLFIACLRVPGTDSLALSLLIENSGTNSLDIIIVAPAFVNLEQSQVQLKAKEYKEVKVSLASGANDTTILLKSRESQCTLNLHTTLLLEPPRTSSLNIYLTRFTSVCIVMAIMSLLVLTYLCVKFRKSYSEAAFPYQKLDMELPVSTGGREFSEKKPENWDNWGDGWDDEEAPLTPSKLTPSKPISKPLSKGLNSRKFSKEGWRT